MNTKIKRILYSITLIVMVSLNSFANNTDWGNAQWIWQQEDGPSNTWMSFRKTVTIDELPSTVEAHIAVDSKYWLWINGEMVVFEGGFSRGPSQAGTWNRTAGITPTNSWSETIDIKPYLKTGDNTIAILVWYWGRETHKGTHIDSGKGGLLFSTQIGNQHIVSNSSWKAIQHPGYDNTIEPASDNLVQYSVKYDAQTSMNDWTDTAWYTGNFNDTSWANATEKGEVGVAPWYDLIENYVPPLINHGLQDYENNAALGVPFVSTGQVYRCQLPFNKQITPYLEIEAEAGKVITITTDNQLNKITGTYKTKGGVQAFESFSWMSGHEILYTIPAGVTVRALKYRWMSVGEMAGSYEVSDPFYQKLWDMGDKTLFVCARDNFMDTPDRERALWIGDVADQTGYLFYSMDNSGHQLLKKAILQTMYFSENKVIGALGPLRVRELVGQSLQFIAQTVWPYYFNTGDRETLEIAYPYVYDYLALFPMQSNGLPEYRRSKSPDTWDWLDWGVSNTIDKQPIQPAYYYMALVAAKQMAETLGKTEHIAFYTERINSIKENYDKVFWKDGFYSSNAASFKDDRANALAIVSGIAKSENYAAIVDNVLVPNKFSSPHFEWVAEEAMFIAGKYKESLTRMKEQYASQVNSGLSTLYENFPRGGTYNHAWNASNKILSQYVAGVKPTGVAWSTYEVTPNLVHMNRLKTKVPSVKGDILVDINLTETNFKLELESPNETSAVVGIPKIDMDIIEVKVGDQTIWKDNAFVNGVSGVTFDSEDANFLKFKVIPGTWVFNATIKIDRAPEVSFVSPANNTILDEDYTNLDVIINATDDEGIEKVELYLNEQLIATKTDVPFNFSSSNIPAISGLDGGSYVLKAIATDTEGKSSEAIINIGVLNKANIFTNRLLFYLPLEENGNDESGNNNNATIGSAVMYDTGKYGKGGVFSYTQGSNFTSADKVFEYSSETAYTIAFWLKVTDYTTRGDIIQASSGRTLLYSNGSGLSFTSSHQRKTISFNLDANEKDDWFHVALVIDQREGQREHKFYVNGEQRGSIAQYDEFETDKPKAMGRLIFGSFSATQVVRNFTGMLDEVYMFNDVLSEVEVKELMNIENFQEYLSSLSVTENKLEIDKVTLYPNPASQMLTIVGIEILDAKVYDLSGRIIKTFTVNNNTLDMSSLSNGVYIIRMTDVKGKPFESKFIKQ